MTPTTARRRTARLIAASAAAVGVALGVGLGPAAGADGPMPQTREHVLLAVSVDPSTSTAGVIGGGIDVLRLSFGDVNGDGQVAIGDFNRDGQVDFPDL